MGRKLKLGLMILLLVLSTGGFLLPVPAVAPKALCAVVTQIDVTCSYRSYTLSRRYTAPDKLEAVLTYLRLLKPRSVPATDPEQVAGERYRLVLTFSDGKRKEYIQHSYRYLSADYAPWHTIDQTTAARLHDLMESLPGD